MNRLQLEVVSERADQDKVQSADWRWGRNKCGKEAEASLGCEGLSA